MATAVKTCRVCGKNYEACHTMNKAAGIFRWQEVACSPECGAEYLRRVTEARNPVPSVARSNKPKRKATPAMEAVAPDDMPMVEPENQDVAEMYAEMPAENE